MNKNCFHFQLNYIVFSVVIFLVGCTASDDSAELLNNVTPTIFSFSAEINQITVGESTTLTGVFAGGVGVVNNGIGEIASGQRLTVTPAETTTYNLNVTGSNGDSQVSSTTINVIQLPKYSHLKQLILPKNINVIAGQSFIVFFDDIILVDDINNYMFVVKIDGKDVIVPNHDHWKYFADSGNTGNHKLEVIVNDLDGFNVDYGVSNLRVSALPAPKNIRSNLLVIGDSLTSNGNYVRDLGNKILSSGINDINFIGTVSNFGYNYEGYGGNKWKTFFEAVSPKSPFVYIDSGLDFVRYFDEKTNGERPEYVIIMLGVNDVFTTDGSMMENITDRATEVFRTADLFIDEIKSALPSVKLLITSIVVPNIRTEAFVDNYGNKYTRENYRVVQHFFVMLQQKHFSNLESKGIYFSPVFYGLDSLNGFPDNNALHPNLLGYSQIADMIFNEFMYIYSIN